MDIQLTSVTPDSAGFAELRSQSMAEGFNMLRRLEDNWLSGHNRFDRPGEKLIGASVEGFIIGVCGLNIDPFTLKNWHRTSATSLCRLRMEKKAGWQRSAQRDT